MSKTVCSSKFLEARYGDEFKENCIRLAKSHEKLERKMKRHNWRGKVRGQRRYI